MDEVVEEGGQQKAEKVHQDAMDWVAVLKKTELRTERGKQEEEGMKSRSTVQILLKVDGSKAFPVG